VIPLTSNCARVRTFQVLLPKEATNLPKDSKAQVEQVRSVAIERLGPRVGSVPTDLMKSIEEALRLHLDL
jgi:mRNA interferase MazF